MARFLSDKRKLPTCFKCRTGDVFVEHRYCLHCDITFCVDCRPDHRCYGCGGRILDSMIVDTRNLVRWGKKSG